MHLCVHVCTCVLVSVSVCGCGCGCVSLICLTAPGFLDMAVDLGDNGEEDEATSRNPLEVDLADDYDAKLPDSNDTAGRYASS